MWLESLAIHELPAGLSGEVDGEVLTGVLGQLGVTDWSGGGADTDSGYQNTPLSGDIPAGYPGQPHWLVSAGPHQVGPADVEAEVDVVEGGRGETSVLSDLATQRPALASSWVAVPVLGWLTDGDLLAGALLAVLNLQTAPHHLLQSHLLAVLTDLSVHQLLLLATDRPGDGVALLHLLHPPHLHLLLRAGRLEAGQTDTSNLGQGALAAVVPGMFLAAISSSSVLSTHTSQT